MRLYTTQYERTPRPHKMSPLNKEALLYAEDKGNRALADANAAHEAGDTARADKLYEKGQRWLDKANAIREGTE